MVVLLHFPPNIHASIHYNMLQSTVHLLVMVNVFAF